jgi:hypothetical protein
MMNPKFVEGGTIDYFGVGAYIYDVVPYSDYSWKVTLHVGNEGEQVTVRVPTDYHTETGVSAYDDEDIRFPWE